MTSIELSARAKINLGLRVTAKRADGYHEVITLYQRISLCDKLYLESRKHTIEYKGPELTGDVADNLCVKAARGFQTAFGDQFGVKIRLEKHIPAGAGLGGGSSDAAAVLEGMARMNGIEFPSDRLVRLAVDLGADVPFFLSGKSSAIGTGIGEKLTDSSGLASEFFLVILWPGFETSTALAYRMLDDYLTFDTDIVNIIICQFLAYGGGNPTMEMSNDFEQPIFTAHPELVDMRDRLIEAGATVAGLCGSGSALFGIFESETQARAAQSERRSPWLCFVCRPE